MFEIVSSMSSFSVDDLEKARGFYGGTLGFEVRDQMGGLHVTAPGGQRIFLYPKPDHQPATFTVLNLIVPDLDAALAELGSMGLSLQRYPSTPEMPVDDHGVLRDPETGHGIAWIADPAGNVIGITSS